MHASSSEPVEQNQVIDSEEQMEGPPAIAPLTLLPEITSLSDDLDLGSIIAAGDADVDKLNKRASNVQKLALENEKLKAELQAMSERLEAAEKRREELRHKKQEVKEPHSQ
ncbi:hypothetical protein D9758_003198 [Tetrapyrgos nigripes]|uniref:Uncharacterized protein n=1 Tax=Tetrapyrgos nigripes TaxID=182062 RepID=A0A8H5LQG2_9AGAR|nr:hypothetical protein D9758_003198 [Tetrapyrgos nigripes]